MLEHVSWPSYLAGTLFSTLIYYSWVALRFYRQELAGVFQKKKLLTSHPDPATGQSVSDVFGSVEPDHEQVYDDQELRFGPAEDDEVAEKAASASAEPYQVSEFSEMVGEVKTLIRVIAESSESRENFDMLFGLITQKYAGLSATPFRTKINDFLLAESDGIFPFELNEENLNELWDEHLKQ